MEQTTHQYCRALAALRSNIGITQREAADVFQVAERTYCGWENGRKKLKRWQFLGMEQLLREVYHEQFK